MRGASSHGTWVVPNSETARTLTGAPDDSHAHLLRMRLALASIRRFASIDNFPSCTSLLARALALAAWRRSGMGYFLLPGSPNSSFGK